MYSQTSCIIIHNDHVPTIPPPTTISPGPPLFPLNPRECGSLDLAPFLTVSCLTAIWRPSFRYWPICALCLSMSSAVSLAVLGGFSCLLPTSFLPKRWLTHALTFPLAHCLVFTVLPFRKDRVRVKKRNRTCSGGGLIS